MILTISILAGASAVGYSGYSLGKHQQRNLKVGCASATQEMMQHESWEAVVDNYVYIHNAFRNDLQRMITALENNNFSIAELERWDEIFELHSRTEDEIYVVALQARLKRDKSSDNIPNTLLSGNDHTRVKKLVQASLECNDNVERLNLLKQLAIELESHLQRKEECIPQLLLKHFSKRELWALYSFMFNPKLNYIDNKKTLMKVTKWWFANISVAEGSRLAVHFVKCNKQPHMTHENWRRIQADIPALQTYNVQDIIMT
jgi:hypothetical protein